jgi:hypothetical protein
MLGDFHLLDGLSKRSTITGTVFTGDSDLLSTFSLISKTLNQWLQMDGWFLSWIVVLPFSQSWFKEGDSYSRFLHFILLHCDFFFESKVPARKIVNLLLKMVLANQMLL